MNPDVNNNDQFVGWIMSTQTLSDAVNAAPSIISELMEAYNNDWFDHCAEANTCPQCGVVSNGDQTIGDHGMCHNCFVNQPLKAYIVTFEEHKVSSVYSHHESIRVFAVDEDHAEELARDNWDDWHRRSPEDWIKVIDIWEEDDNA